MSEMRRSMAARSQHPATGTQVKSVTRHGITWEFLDYETVGQYVNGDWWVVGPVTITSITRPHATNGKDGSLVNVGIGPGVEIEGFDAAFNDYSATRDISRSLPYVLSTGSSLVSVVSWAPGEVGSPWPRPAYRRASILNCVSTPPSVTAFRPSAFGVTKYNFDASNITYANLPGGVLPSLSVPSGPPSMATVEAYIEKLYLDNHNGAGDDTQYTSPSENMPNYGDLYGLQVGRAGLFLCLNPATVGDKTTLLRRLIQLGIDNYGMLKNGCKWVENGALNYWRKFPILVAGQFLNDPGMRAVGTDYPGSGRYFAEDSTTFTVSDSDTTRVIAQQLDIDVSSASTTSATGTITRTAGATEFITYLWGYAFLGSCLCKITSGTGINQVRRIVSSSQVRGTNINNGGSLTINIDPATPWSPAPDATSTVTILGYRTDDVGLAEWGILHTASPGADSPSPEAEYRALPFRYAAALFIAAHSLGLKTIWNQDSTFDYMDRYMTETQTTHDGWYASTRAYSAWDAAVWDTHRGSF